MTSDSPTNQIALELVHAEEYVVELECRVSSAGWVGHACAYTSNDELVNFTQSLREFSENPAVPIEWRAGDEAVGFVGLSFYQIDRSGHVCCYVQLATNGISWRGKHDSRLSLEMPTELGFVITFARHLTRIVEEMHGQAVLAGCI